MLLRVDTLALGGWQREGQELFDKARRDGRGTCLLLCCSRFPPAVARGTRFAALQLTRGHPALVAAGPDHTISASLLWDIDSLYDSLEFDRPFEQGLDRICPPQVLILEGLSHLACRAFREDRSLSEPVQRTRASSREVLYFLDAGVRV